MDIVSTLSRLKESGNYRSIPPVVAECRVDFSTNDYLGIGSDLSMRRQFMESAENRMIALTSSASRLLASSQSEYYALEEALGSLYGRDVLLFNSGYHANTGMVSALADSKTMVLADKLVHASIIDGITLSKCKFSRFRHNDYNHLESLIKRHYDDFDRLLVIVEGVYSMDGDRADIETLVSFKKNYDKIMLYVDEAHSFGVLGPQGLGIVEAYRRSNPDEDAAVVDVIVGTFGKAAGSFGAFCVTSRDIKELAVNTARSFIFSTALPPLCCAWTLWVLCRMVEMDSRRERVAILAKKLRDILSEYSSGETYPSHIQPLIVGDAAKVVNISRALMESGVKVLPIRTPTVPPGTERLRFSLSASMTDGDLDILEAGLRTVMNR